MASSGLTLYKQEQVVFKYTQALNGLFLCRKKGSKLGPTMQPHLRQEIGLPALPQKAIIGPKVTAAERTTQVIIRKSEKKIVATNV